MILSLNDCWSFIPRFSCENEGFDSVVVFLSWKLIALIKPDPNCTNCKIHYLKKRTLFSKIKRNCFNERTETYTDAMAFLSENCEHRLSTFVFLYSKKLLVTCTEWRVLIYRYKTFQYSKKLLVTCTKFNYEYSPLNWFQYSKKLLVTLNEIGNLRFA